jgi:hypothetical protein
MTDLDMSVDNEGLSVLILMVQRDAVIRHSIDCEKLVT